MLNKVLIISKIDRMANKKCARRPAVCDQILRRSLVIARDPALREPSPDVSGRGNLKTIKARDCFGREVYPERSRRAPSQ